MVSRRVAGLAAALALSACSYLNMDRPPRAVRRGDLFPGCTTENKYPYLDLAITAFAVVGAVMIYAGYGGVDDPDDPTMKRELSGGERAMFGTFALLEGGLFALSARYGFEQSARCRELQPRLASPPYPQQPPYPPQQQTYPPPPAQPYPPPAQPYPPPAGGAP